MKLMYSSLEYLLRPLLNVIFQCTVNTILSTCDIKSLYTNIKHDVFYKAIEYWIDKFHDDIPLLSRFTKAFVLEGLNIILKFNYFCINKNFFHQIKGTAMGIIFAVVGSNLTVAYFEVKMFALLPQIYPRDFVDYFARNYFRFLDDIFHTWLINFDIEPFYKLINELDPDLKFIFEKLTTDINLLDINIKIVDNQLHFDNYHKPTSSFSYVKYDSCHPSHTKNNISLSLARRIIRIVTDNRDYRLEELRQNLLKRNHPEKIINYSFTKSFQPKNNNEENKEIITFTRTYNPNHNFNYNRFNNCLNNINNRELRETLSNKKVLLTTRQPKNLKNILVTAKFDLHPELPNRKPNGLFSCKDCIYHKNGYIKPCKSFTFKLTNGKSVTWNYNKCFDCDSKDVLYILICNNCDYFYLRKTIDFKQRIGKQKSDVKHPQNSTCRECAEHLRDCAKIEPFFFDLSLLS